MLAKKQIMHNMLGITDVEFSQMRDLIYQQTGISLADHKRALVCSRLGKRLRYLGLNSYQEYHDFLVKDGGNQKEMVEMINAITTNKTQFFRENDHFKYMQDTLLPNIINSIGTRTKRLRIWSAGTSTGEEAYCLAMLVAEAFESQTGWDVKILATDIDTNVLRRAEEGIYTYDQVNNIVPQSLLSKYFMKGRGDNDGRVIVKKNLKSLVYFRRLNLFEHKWPMQGPFEIIFCRNVIIYFNKETQSKIITKMHNLLREGGHLMLGHSESLYGMDSMFSYAGHSMYTRKKVERNDN